LHRGNFCTAANSGTSKVRRAGAKLSKIRLAPGEDALEKAIPPPIPAPNDAGFVAGPP
jgi:hypothetical protein